MFYAITSKYREIPDKISGDFNANVLILLSLLLTWFGKRTFGLFKRFGLQSFKVIKQLFLQFPNIRLTNPLLCIIFFPSTLTLLLMLSGIFLT